MNGADSLLETLVRADIDVCFTNPGTSEMHFVAALDQQDGMRGILGLFEGVVTGAADGYARMAEKPACTLLHLGPGLANGLANLHNARRARVPVVNIVGDHATYHRSLDAPLTSNIEGFAAPVSGWIRVSEDAQEVAADTAKAVQASFGPPGQVATLILPADTAWNDATGPAEPLPRITPTLPQGDNIRSAGEALVSGRRCALLLNGAATTAQGLESAGRIAKKTGATLLGDTFLTRISRGAGRVDLTRIPYFAEQAEEVLAGIDYLILVGTKAPVTFFAYPGKPSELTPKNCTVVPLAGPEEDVLGSLDALEQEIGSTSAQPIVQERSEIGLPNGPLTPETIARSIAAQMPDNTVVINEAATSGFAIPTFTANAAPHEWLDLTGGAIGIGLPLATGAAVACPDRKVIALEADGSGMYTVQALWTHARESHDITTVVFSNRKYAILQVEFMRVGAHNPGPKAMSMLELTHPDLNWVELAAGMGVPGTQATTTDEFNKALKEGLRSEGPYLIEALV